MKTEEWLQRFGAQDEIKEDVLRLSDYELWIVCWGCDRQRIFLGSDHQDCMRRMRQAGWVFDATVNRHHLCPECLEREGVAELFQ